MYTQVRPLELQYVLLPGDVFNLKIGDKTVSSKPFTKLTRITHWAWIKIKNHCGYVVGDENLERDLIQAGFKIKPILE